MVRFQIWIAGKQKGDNYSNLNKAIAVAESLANHNKQVFIFEDVNGYPSTRAKWVNGVRVS